MDQMTEIAVYVPEKYLDTAAYTEVCPGIYRNLSLDNYCVSLSAKVIPRYPLRTMLEQFRLHFAKRGDVRDAEIDGQPRKIIEAETRDCKESSLRLLRNFASAAGKTVVNFRLSGYDVLGVLFGTTDCVINGQQIQVPVIGSRDDLHDGALSFEPSEAEPALIRPFTDGSTLSFPQLPEKAKVRAVMTRIDFAYLVFMEKNLNKALVFGKQGFCKILEDEDLVDEVMRGEMHDA